jgi:signal transduction histidine kinase
VQAHALQIAREALSNALRHGAAKHVRIGLEREDGRLAFTVEDDGRGFDPANLLKPGLGLTNIDERAREIGGRLTVSSTPGKGTIVKLTLPRPVA